MSAEDEIIKREGDLAFCRSGCGQVRHDPETRLCWDCKIQIWRSK